ncbi:exopolysaccharide biosynthesis protein [Alphaproteobacteria bacterium]|nr:exopolysaccharide biosynthesis protein [Alphaproteobacteria bacterium]
MTEIRSISELLIDLKTTLKGDRVSIGMLLEEMHERGFGVLMFFFAIPIGLPVPVPLGVSPAFAIPLLVLTAQMIAGRGTIWMPKRTKKRSFKRTTLEKTIDVSVPWLRRIEYLIRPRLGFMTSGGASRVVGVLGFIMAASIFVPIPLTNSVPGMGICAMAIGLVMRDGLAVIVGAIVGTAWSLMVFFVLIYFGMEGVDLIKDFIKGMFA